MSGSSKNKNNDKTEELLKDDEKKEEDSPYQTLVRSLTNRGKNKRKVKLVEDKLIQLTFGDHSDSEDDEDFTLDDADLDSDDSNYCKYIGIIDLYVFEAKFVFVFLHLFSPICNLFYRLLFIKF